MCKKSVDVTATNEHDTQKDSANAGQHDFGESSIQTYQKKKGKSTKRKEVMISFGVVKCDGGGVRQQEQMLKQKNVIKESEDGWRTDNINYFQCQNNYFQCQKRPAH